MTLPYDYIPMRPIPISERLPKPYDPNMLGLQDCDPQGRCWCGSSTLMTSGWGDEDLPYPPFWELRTPLNEATHWLPWWALPLPEAALGLNADPSAPAASPSPQAQDRPPTG
jgi:hypothetical protein